MRVLDRTEATTLEPGVEPATSAKKTTCLWILGMVLVFAGMLLAATVISLGPHPLGTIHATFGRWEAGLGAPRSAIQEFSLALEIQPDDVQARIGRGRAYLTVGAVGSATGDFLRAAQLAPDDLEVQECLAMAFDEQGNSEKALEAYTRVVELAPDEAAGYINRGRVYLEIQDYGRAVQDFSQALSLDASAVDAYVMRGSAYQGIGDSNAAIHDFGQAIEMDPGNGWAYAGRAAAFASKGDMAQAIADFGKATEFMPGSADLHLRLGKIYAIQKEPALARAEFSQALGLNLSLTEAYFLRGLTDLELEDFNQAVGDFTKVINADPSDAAALSNRCWAYLNKGIPLLALHDCELSLDSDPDSLPSLDHRAHVYLALGRIEDARFDFGRIVDLQPESDMSKQAKEELAALAVSHPMSEEITVVKGGTNLARYKTARASRDASQGTALRAIDNSQSTWWSAGALAPEWIDIDLGGNFVVAEIRLLPWQDPAGVTLHRILVKGPATGDKYILLTEYHGLTSDLLWLRYVLPVPLEGIRYVRIETLQDPAVVGWREIQVIAGQP